MRKFKEVLKEIRGTGQGKNGPLQGDGGADICICPECGYEVKHKKGVPCNTLKCKECGSSMIGK